MPNHAVNVTIALTLADDLGETIRQTDPRLNVTALTRAQRRVYRDGRPLWAGYPEPPRAEDESEEEARERLAPILRETEVLLTNPIVPDNIVERAPALQWLQLTSAGVDRRMTGAEAGFPDADEMLPPADLTDLLQKSDYVVVALPLTRESRGLIGEAQLRAMKPSAVIVNIGRGAVIDEQALVQALKDGAIAGAALAVFQQ